MVVPRDDDDARDLAHMTGHVRHVSPLIIIIASRLSTILKLVRGKPVVWPCMCVCVCLVSASVPCFSITVVDNKHRHMLTRRKYIRSDRTQMLVGLELWFDLVGICPILLRRETERNVDFPQ